MQIDFFGSSGNVLFYPEDLDISCITQSKIRGTCIPHYTNLRGKPGTNKFITDSGSTCDTVIVNGKYWRIFVFSKN